MPFAVIPGHRLLVILVLQSLRSLIFAPNSGDSVAAIEVFQSSVCSPVDEQLQRQCFSELPADRYEILEGSPVRMRCRVSRQQGKAQWRAHNTLLGYDRELRNWPKYSMQGNPDAGEHDLFISSVSSEDAGIFECQVTPTANQPLLRRSTNLSVLVVPSKPVILAPPGDPQPTKNGQLVISRPGYSSEGLSKDPSNANDKLWLICQARGGVPAPSFEWFHNGMPVRNSYMEGKETRSADSFASSGGGDGEATLVIPKSDLITGDRLTCLVSNKATQRAANLGQQKLLAEIIVTVQTPPGAPVILSPEGHIVDSMVKNEGDIVTLTCQSKPPGSPPGELIWRWEHTSSLSQSPFQNNAGDPTAAFSSTTELAKLPSLEQYSRQNSDRNQLESQLNLPGVKRAQNGLYIVCITRHMLGMEQKAKILLNVKYTFSGVCIHKQEMGSGQHTIPGIQDKINECTSSQSSSSSPTPRILYVHPERKQIFSCSTTPFFGHATIKWYGAVTANDADWYDLTNLTSIAELKRGGVNGGSYIKTVSLRLPPANSVRIGALQCRGYTSVNADPNAQTNIVDQVMLKSYEAPQRPVIRAESEREGLEEGDILKLKCEATDGEPHGRISWLKATRENTDYTPIYLISTTEHDKRGKRIFSNLDIQLTADDHLSSFKCASSNPGYPVSEAQTSAAFHVNLTFRPQHIRVDRLTETHNIPQEAPEGDPPKSITVTAGELLSLMCTAGPANPPVPLQWRQIICGSNDDANQSVLLDPSSSMNGKTPCKIINNFGDAKALPLLRSRMVSRSQVSLLVQAHHHQSRVECSTLGPEKYDEHPNWSARPLEKTSRLKNDVLLNVLFKPNFSNVLSKLNSSTSKYLPQYVTVEGASVELDLTPSSNPPIISARWFHGKFDPQTLGRWVEITERLSLPSGAPAQLRLPRVGVEHMGSYKITGTNSVGSADLVFFLNVTHAPRLIGEPLINATTKGNEAELKCRVKANPPPNPNSVYWRRVTDETPMAQNYASTMSSKVSSNASPKSQTTLQKPFINGLRCNQEFIAGRAKYYVKCFTPEPYHLVSTLHITDVDPGDVGRYECFVDNGIGSPVVRFIDLIYPFAPRVLQIERWMRAAPAYDPPKTAFNQTQIASHSPVPPTSIFCMIAAEPAPTVTWFREPANLTLVEGGQFKSSVSRVHAGRYRALLSIEFVRRVDFGSYFCQATNTMGVDIGRVLLGPASPPGKPGNPILLKATSSSLTIGWQQGFNGGPPQTFVVKWAPNDAPDAMQATETKEDLMSEVMKHTIENLSKATTYRICVSAKNALHKASPATDYLIASTTAAADPPEEAMRDEAQAGSGGWRPNAGQMAGVNSLNEDGDPAARGSSPSISMIITIATCFGCLIFITNLIIVGLVLHRRHQRKSSKLKRIPGTDSLVKCGVMDAYPTADCYPDRFLNGQHVFGPYLDSASQKDSLSQYQFEHFTQCSPSMPAEYISSTGSYFPRDSPLNLFTNSPAMITAAEQHAAAMQHHAQQHRLNSQTMSRSSSPLHSSRSHGLQPPTTPSSLEHPSHLSHQRHPSFTTSVTGSYPHDQSIYLVAAPNPHRYLADDPLGAAAAAAAALYGGLPPHHPGTVSPHSLTDKSVGGVSEGRGGGAGSSGFGGGGSRVVHTGATTLGYYSSPRMITSFYSPPRSDLNGGISNNLGSQLPNSFGQVSRRNSSFASPDRVYPVENATLERSPKRPIVSFTNDGCQPLLTQVTDMDAVNAVGVANDLTISSDLAATIPPPTDFGLPPPPVPVATTNIDSSPSPYPSSSATAVRVTNSPLRQQRFGISGESGIEWLGSQSHHPVNGLVRGGTIQQQTPLKKPPGVHFDTNM
uniref:Nephrin n=1 Tax=Mesocestoides corti TaxID=53468 RepID=A0A5K3ERS8_MESCO